MDMKRNTMRFYAQSAIVFVLATFGFLALCAEPTEDANFLLVVIGQFVCAAAFFTAASLLGRKWGIIRKLKNIKF